MLSKQTLSTLPTSWVCVKEVADFHQLQRDLIPYVSWIKVRVANKKKIYPVEFDFSLIALRSGNTKNDTSF